MGTVGYMAPEQSLGGTDVDSRADIYSLGVVAYEMLAGNAPFAGGSTQAILAAHLTQEPPHLDRLREDVPLPVLRAIEKALEKDPANRFQTASEFATACSTQKTTGRRSAISRLPVVRDLHRLPVKNVVAAAVVTVVAVAGGWYWFHRPPVLPNETVTVVVAPFDVSTRALQVWHEGMVDLLAREHGRRRAFEDRAAGARDPELAGECAIGERAGARSWRNAPRLSTRSMDRSYRRWEIRCVSTSSSPMQRRTRCLRMWSSLTPT